MKNRSPAQLIDRLLTRPELYRLHRSPLVLEPFLAGARVADSRLARANSAALSDANRADSLSLCQRFYLSPMSEESAYNSTLKTLRAQPDLATPPESPMYSSFFEYVADPIRDGRPGLFGGGTFAWLLWLSRGYRAALPCVDEALAELEEVAWSRFESRVKSFYGTPDVDWERPMWVLEHTSEARLARFVELWEGVSL